MLPSIAFLRASRCGVGASRRAWHGGAFVPFGYVGSAFGPRSTLAAHEWRWASLRSRYPCSRSDSGRSWPLQCGGRQAPFSALGSWARVCCVAYRTRRNGLATNVAIRGRAAEAARGGPESSSRAPSSRWPFTGAYGNGSRGDGSGFWMRNVQRAYYSSNRRTTSGRIGGRGPNRAAMLGTLRVGRSLGRLGRTTGAARPRPRASPRKLEECYLVDPASSHMLVSKIKPCMCKYEQIQTVKLRMAH